MFHTEISGRLDVDRDYDDVDAEAVIDFDASRHHPAFVGASLHAKVVVDQNCSDHFDASVAHPSLVSYL